MLDHVSTLDYFSADVSGSLPHSKPSQIILILKLYVLCNAEERFCASFRTVIEFLQVKDDRFLTVLALNENCLISVLRM